VAAQGGVRTTRPGVQRFRDFATAKLARDQYENP
jgi:hypothetical protein